MRPSAAFTLVLLLTSTTSLATECFWPDGEIAVDQAPCNQQAKESHCCGVDDVCLDNGYCLQTTVAVGWTNRLGRAACTDATFESDACPYYCSDVAMNTSTSVFLAYDEPDGAFCCHLNYNLTSGKCQLSTKGAGFQPFNLPSSQVINNRSDGSILPNTTSVARHITTVAPSSTCSSAATVTDIAVPLGISIPLGVALLAALVTALLFWRRNKALRREIQEQQASLAQLCAKSPESAEEHRLGASHSVPSYYELGNQQLSEFDGQGVYEVPVGSPPKGF